MRFVPIGAVCRVVSGSTPATSSADYWDGDVVWITPADLGKLSERYITASSRRITDLGRSRANLPVVPPGSVVLSSRAPIGHLAISEIELCTNQGCKSLIPSPDVDVRYLYWALKSRMDDLRRLGSGATFAEVSKSQVEAFEIPLPPHSRQLRIADQLDEQMGAARRAKDAADARIRSFSLLLESAVDQRIDGLSANDAPRVRLRDILESPLRTGISKPSVSDGDFACLTLSSVRAGIIDTTKANRCALTEQEGKANSVRPGAFYVVRGNGNLRLVGRGARAPHVLPANLVFPDLLIEVRAAPHLVDFDYLSFAWNARSVRADIERRAATAAGIHKINLRNLGEVTVPLPPLRHQREIAARLLEVAGIGKAITSATSEQLEAIRVLPGALLRQVFEPGNVSSGL